MKKAKKKTKLTAKHVVAISLFSTPFLLWGIYSAFYFLKTSAEYSSMQSWVETPTTIESVELAVEHRDGGTSRRGGGRSMYKVIASYAYQFDGQTYRGERVSLYGGSDGNSEHHHAVHNELKRHLDQQRPFRCFVDPNDAQHSVLYRDWRWKVSGLHLMHAVLFGGMGLFLIGSSLYYWRKQVRGA